MDTQNHIAPRKRTWLGRSRRGCIRCKAKHLKCDEKQPCTRCLRANMSCTVGLTTLNPDWTPIEQEAFNYFTSCIAPAFLGPLDSQFFAKHVACIAQSVPPVFNALLGCSTLFRLTQEEIFRASIPSPIQRRYRAALEWYSASFTSVTDLPCLLLGSVIYMYTEMRLGHIINAEHVARAAFGLAHSNRAVLGAGDSVVLCSLYQLLKFPVILPLRSVSIPTEHRVSVLVIALSICARIADENTRLFFEFLGLVWDLDDVVGGRSIELDERFQTYYQAFWKVDDGPHMMYTVTQIQWQVYKYGLRSHRRMLEDRVLYVLECLEGWIKFTMRRATMAWALDTDFGPLCVLIVWYWRVPWIVERIEAALAGFEGAFRDTILVFLRELAVTDYDTATPLESELFGGQPKVLQIWHASAAMRCLAFRCSQK